MKNISTLFVSRDETSALDRARGVIFTKQAYTRLSLSLLQGRKRARGEVGELDLNRVQPPTFLGQRAPHRPTGRQAISDHMCSMKYNLLIIINNENYSNKDIRPHPTSPASASGHQTRSATATVTELSKHSCQWVISAKFIGRTRSNTYGLASRKST